MSLADAAAAEAALTAQRQQDRRARQDAHARAVVDAHIAEEAAQARAQDDLAFTGVVDAYYALQQPAFQADPIMRSDFARGGRAVYDGAGTLLLRVRENETGLPNRPIRAFGPVTAEFNFKEDTLTGQLAFTHALVGTDETQDDVRNGTSLKSLQRTDVGGAISFGDYERDGSSAGAADLLYESTFALGERVARMSGNATVTMSGTYEDRVAGTSPERLVIRDDPDLDLHTVLDGQLYTIDFLAIGLPRRASPLP
jgi:hypothetical protein